MQACSQVCCKPCSHVSQSAASHVGAFKCADIWQVDCTRRANACQQDLPCTANAMLSAWKARQHARHPLSLMCCELYVPPASAGRLLPEQWCHTLAHRQGKLVWPYFVVRLRLKVSLRHANYCPQHRDLQFEAGHKVWPIKLTLPVCQPMASLLWQRSASRSKCSACIVRACCLQPDCLPKSVTLHSLPCCMHSWAAGSTDLRCACACSMSLGVQCQNPCRGLFLLPSHLVKCLCHEDSWAAQTYVCWTG